MLNIFINDCNQLITEHNEGKRSYPHWTDHVLSPLIREIGMRLGMKYKVSGVFGLRTQSYISLLDDAGECLYILSVTPRFAEIDVDVLLPANYGRTALLEGIDYDTGELINPERDDDLNGFNRVTAPLPDDVDEIIRIMREHAASEALCYK